MYEPYRQHLVELDNTTKYRKLPEVSLSGQKFYLDFSTNDYLALSRCPEILEAAAFAAKTYGIGATGSRLLSGNSKIFESFESKIAQDKQAEAALIFNSGFQTNLSVLSSLLDEKVLKSKPLVFFDKLNHASLYQAVFLTKSELVRYQHNNMEHLSDLLSKYKNNDRPKFIVAETIFGMDGDILPINEIVALATQHNAFLYLDEAHATGVVGHHGYGLSTTVNLRDMPHLVMGTFSKALGCSGGYVACPQILKEYLINKAGGFIYSTANSPMVIGAASKAWDIIKTFDKERESLLNLGLILRNRLLNLGFNVGNSVSHIVPIIVGKEEAALRMQKELFLNNILVSCVRSPTVPPGTSRIRIALNVSHSESDVDQLINVLKVL